MRATTRPSSPRTKLLVVRQPVKPAHRAHHPDRTPIRLALGVVVAVGVLALVWLMGHLGYRLGFAPLMRAPDLVGEPGLGLATGTLMIISIPRVILQAGLSQPLWLMIAFAMIAIPAGGLSAARPLTPGGPMQKQSFVVMASVGAAAAGVTAALAVWWTVSPARTNLIAALPALPADAARWYADIQTAAGLDVLAVIVVALWVVLSLRLPVQTWLRALAASAAFFALLIAIVAMSISNATAAQLGAPRSRCMLDGESISPRIILGSTPQHMATLVVYDGNAYAVVEMRNHPDAISITGRQSIVNYLIERAPAED